VSETTVPLPYVPPGGSAVTDPEPVPFIDHVSEYRLSVKVAVTLLAPFIVTLQGLALPEQAPDHPVNSELPAGVAVSVTTVPAVYVPFTGSGLAETAPDPLPFVDHASAYWAGGGGAAVTNAPKTNDIGPAGTVFTTHGGV
jgi:hypothetical protein